MMHNRSNKRFIIGTGTIKSKDKIKPMSNFDIEAEFGDDPKFVGVFPKDILPEFLEKGESLILNLDDSDGGGTHWTCIYHGDAIEYFDSYGMAPPEEALRMMKNSNENCLYSTSQIQTTTSNKCGWYCVHYIKERNHGRSMYDIIYSFEQIMNPLDQIDDPDIVIR